MYVLKVRFKGDSGPKYLNGWSFEFVKDLKAEDKVRRCIITLAKAEAQFKAWIKNKETLDGDLEYVSVVRVNTYHPHSEMEVIHFREFK